MATRTAPPEYRTLHFALGHIGMSLPFELCVGIRRFALQAHTPESRERHAVRNKALGLLPPDQVAEFTHYAEDVPVPSERTLLLRVTTPRTDQTSPLPTLAALAVHIPVAARRAHRQQGDLSRVALFDFHDLPQPKSDDQLALSLDADDLVTPAQTAVTLVFQHPQLGTVNPQTASVVIDDHIQAKANATNVARFAGAIQSQGPNWSTAGVSTTYQGDTLTWGPGFSNSGQPVDTYSLTPKTLAAAGAPLALPLTTSQNDAKLRNQSWSSSQGVATVQRDAGVSPTAARRSRLPLAHALRLGDPSADFTLDNLTPGHGLSIDDSSLVFTPDTNTLGAGSFSIDVMNNYLRSLWAYVAFFDANDQPVSGWNSIDLVSPVNVVLGIPVDTDPTTLTFDWPAAASRATLAHGGFGTSNWDNDLVWNGIILTGVFNYGVPCLFLWIGSVLDSNALLKTIEKDYPTIVAIFKYATSIIGTLGTNSIGFPNIKTVLAAFADGIAGLIVHAGLEKLQAYIVAELGEAELEDAIPYVNIIFQIANRAVDLVEIGETTVEILTSPAVYSVNILRAMPTTVTVRPDPTHGTQDNPAIWPLDSDHYQCILQYTGATSYTQSGPMLGVNSSEPITVNYDSVPEGGTCQVQFSVYATDDTLLGRWTSAWVAAQRPQPTTVLNLAGAIQETLVPLTPSTIYTYKEKLVYNGATSSHCWQSNQFALPDSVVSDLDNGQIDAATKTAFAANATPLDGSAAVTVVQSGIAWNIVDGSTRYALNFNTNNSEVIVTTNNAPLEVLPLNTSDLGNNLGSTVDLTMNNRAYMLGYCWMASGQDVPAAGTTSPIITSQINTFQNINVLANPEASLKFTGVGFSNQPLIVYDQFGPVPLFSVDSSYTSDLDQGVVSSALTELFAEFSYALPSSGVSVEIVTPSVQWTLTINALPTYSLLAGGGMIDVFPYPAVVVSPNNFYLEPTSPNPTNYGYQVRRIVLDNTTPFDMAQTQSWGQFLLPHLNDAVVHPQGYIVGAHFNLDALEILRLPAASTPDSEAQPAVMVGGTGTRPGLFSGPAALAVTVDGRLLVLERGNQRIQAIDINGNPVPCFASGAVCSVADSSASGLDNSLVPMAVRTAMAAAGYPLSDTWQVRDSVNLYKLIATNTEVAVQFGGNSLFSNWSVADSSSPTPQEFTLALSAGEITVSQGGSTLFTVATSAADSLNGGMLGDVLSSAFVSAGITLVSPLLVTGSNPLTLDLSVVADLTEGTVPSTLAPALATRDMTLGSPNSVQSENVMKVIQATQKWLLSDPAGNATYQLLTSTAGDSIAVTLLTAVMALQPPPSGQALTYLGLSTEAKGYIYVLSYVQPGSTIGNFLLDIYRPDGSYLATTEGLNAGDISVDQWRNLYSLNYESFLGPGNRTEPSISIWTPSA